MQKERSRADSAPSGISGAKARSMNCEHRDEPSQRESNDRFAPWPQSRFVWSFFHGSRILVEARFARWPSNEVPTARLSRRATDRGRLAQLVRAPVQQGHSSELPPLRFFKDLANLQGRLIVPIYPLLTRLRHQIGTKKKRSNRSTPSRPFTFSLNGHMMHGKMATQAIPLNSRYRISAAAMSELESAWQEYPAAVAASDLSQSSQATYVDMANNFVRWLTGDFDPGSRKAPYRIVPNQPKTPALRIGSRQRAT